MFQIDRNLNNGSWEEKPIRDHKTCLHSHNEICQDPEMEELFSKEGKQQTEKKKTETEPEKKKTETGTGVQEKS